MIRPALIALIILFTSALVSCGEIEDLIEDSTARTITLDRTLHNTTSERDYRQVTIAHDVVLTNGQTYNGGSVSMADLADAIDVSQLGLGKVLFFLSGDIRNRGDRQAALTLLLKPQTAGAQISKIGTLTLPARVEYDLDEPDDLASAAAGIHRNLRDVFYTLDANYVVNPLLRVEGGDANGVQIKSLRLAATPVYWRSELIDPGSASEYEKYVEHVHGANLTGTVTNLGTGLAELRIYVSDPNAPDSATDIVAQTFLKPGETIAGENILVVGGGEIIENAFEDLIGGYDVRYDFVVVSAK
ncbi:MAG: hypothetical protein ACTSXZ_11880, partial [Alphaproteobacteria bacterium]